jgi:hypothetical protein
VSSGRGYEKFHDCNDIWSLGLDAGWERGVSLQGAGSAVLEWLDLTWLGLALGRRLECWNGSVIGLTWYLEG